MMSLSSLAISCPLMLPLLLAAGRHGKLTVQARLSNTWAARCLLFPYTCKVSTMFSRQSMGGATKTSVTAYITLQKSSSCSCVDSNMGPWKVKKFRHALGLTRHLRVPQYANAEGAIHCVEYQLAGGIAHIGDMAHVGHFRAFNVLPGLWIPLRWPCSQVAQLIAVAVVYTGVRSAPRETIDLVNPKDFLVHGDGCAPVVGTQSTLKLLLHNVYVGAYIQVE